MKWLPCLVTPGVKWSPVFLSKSWFSILVFKSGTFYWPLVYVRRGILSGLCQKHNSDIENGYPEILYRATESSKIGLVPGQGFSDMAILTPSWWILGLKVWIGLHFTRNTWVLSKHSVFLEFFLNMSEVRKSSEERTGESPVYFLRKMSELRWLGRGSPLLFWISD